MTITLQELDRIAHIVAENFPSLTMLLLQLKNNITGKTPDKIASDMFEIVNGHVQSSADITAVQIFDLIDHAKNPGSPEIKDYALKSFF